MTASANEKIKKKPLTMVMEDYLEAIFDLGKEKKYVRVKDIAARMKVKMPTVSSMLKTLSDRGLVHYEKYEYVELTDKGLAIGREMRNRHEILFEFLTEILKIDKKTADEDACKMEHALSPATKDSLTDFISFIQTCPRAGENWLKHFMEYRLHGHQPEKCIKQTEGFSWDFQKKIRSLKND